MMVLIEYDARDRNAEGKNTEPQRRRDAERERERERREKREERREKRGHRGVK
jgi:hypothetical protein